MWLPLDAQFKRKEHLTHGYGNMRGRLDNWEPSSTYSIGISDYGDSYYSGDGYGQESLLFTQKNLRNMLSDVASFRCQFQRRQMYKYWGVA